METNVIQSQKDLENVFAKVVELGEAMDKHRKETPGKPQKKSSYQTIEEAREDERLQKDYEVKAKEYDEKFAKLQSEYRKWNDVLVSALPLYSWVRIGDKAVGVSSHNWGGYGKTLHIEDWSENLYVLKHTTYN